jgi:hypothetical protein
VALLAAGCGGSSGDTKTVTVAPAPTFTGQATTPSGTATTPAASSAPALAAREGNVNDIPVRLEIIELKRSGSTVALSLRLSTTSDRRAQVADTFDDGIFQATGKNRVSDNPTAEVRNADSVDGIALIDAKNARKHLVGRDAEGNCLCDVDLGRGFVTSDGPLLLSATFGAPPADVQAMDVFVPHYGTFKNVPLEG